MDTIPSNQETSVPEEDPPQQQSQPQHQPQLPISQPQAQPSTQQQPLSQLKQQQQQQQPQHQQQLQSQQQPQVPTQPQQQPSIQLQQQQQQTQSQMQQQTQLQLQPHQTQLQTQQQSQPQSLPQQAQLQLQPQQQQAQLQMQPQVSQHTTVPSSQPQCTVTSSPTVVSQLAQAPRAPMAPGQVRPHAEYVVLLAPNRQQGGVPGYRFPVNLNQQNLIPNQALIRTINTAQLTRAPISSSGGVIQAPSSQAQTTMATIQGGQVQIPFGAAGSRGPITFANGTTNLLLQTRHPMMGSRATLIPQQTLIRGVAQTSLGMSGIPTSQPLGMGIPAQMMHSGFIAPTAATTPSQMTPEEALPKAVTLFNALLAKMRNTPKEIAIQNLIQNLILAKITPEAFATSLQIELESGNQTQLVPFLKLSLEPLRRAMNKGTTSFPGIRHPTDEELREIEGPRSSLSTASGAAKKKKTPLPPGQKSAYAIKKEAREARKKEKELLAAQGMKTEKPDEKKEGEKPVKVKVEKPKRSEKAKKEKQLESLSSALRDDDDVNDVAAMGGVNLAEESQRIMASGADFVGTQIRSCKDEPFLDITVLSSRIAKITKEHNLGEPSEDVVTIVSHATQELLKNIVERLGVLAEHRTENLRLNSKYEVSNDIKGQIKFLAELDRIEKRRCEEQERELLLRVAKSRSKVEDPEQIKLRQKAKDMQRAEQEEVRQREANETALLAIGPRKKMKSSGSFSVSSYGSQSNNQSDVKPNSDIRGDTIRRVKRVNMRDLQVLFEIDRTHLNRSVKLTAQ